MVFMAEPSRRLAEAIQRESCATEMFSLLSFCAMKLYSCPG
jgi:hypothetical protein